MHNHWLVLLSIVVAITASFVTLELTARVVDPYRRSARRAWWLAGGALAMGTGIWAMHFIGMLGYTLPVEAWYDVPITLVSLAIAIGAAAFALVVATRGTLSPRRLVVSGLLMGIAIAGMHYTGMAALRMDPPIRYGPVLFGLSILIAVAASLIALWSAFRLRLETIASALWKKAGSAVVMGTAIFGMHYTGMEAARFAPGSVSRTGPHEIDELWLAVTLGACTLAFLMATLLICALDSYLAFAEQRRLARRIAELQEEERRGLAAELHDIVGQDLSAVNAELALLRSRLPEAAAALESAASLVKKSVEAIRHVMAYLRPPGLDELGLAAGLRWHAENFQTRTAIPVSVTVDGAIGKTAPAAEDALVRVFLEALANVEKHAAANRVEVTLRQTDGSVVLTITDDGRGFDPTAPMRRDRRSGWGLILMRERAAAVGAELRVESAPSAGTRVEFILSEHQWG